MEWDEIICIPIFGACTPEQLEENVAATEVPLSDEQWDRIMNARYNPEGDLWGH
jgi:1-deoxyxylulose-5-phosphate synthase